MVLNELTGFHEQVRPAALRPLTPRPDPAPRVPALQAAISGLVRQMQATGPEMSAPITPGVRLLITPGQALRIASTIFAPTS